MIAELTGSTPITLRTLALNGHTLAYRESGAGTPLLLLHGWGGSSRYWLDTMLGLPQQRTLAPDFPGYGQSPPNGTGTHSELAAWVIAFADALGIEQFDLNGHSFGAGVAIMLAARYPQRVRRLMLTCFSTFRNETERRIVDLVHHVMSVWLMLRAGWQLRAPWFYSAAARRFFHRAPTDQRILRDSYADFLAMHGPTALRGARESANPQINLAMREIQAPTLLIATRQDQIMPASGVPFVAEQIADCRLHWIEQCGHLPMIERPQQYVSLIREFIC